MSAVLHAIEEEHGRRLGSCESEQSGPTLIVVGGLHANEPAGLAAAERVLGQLTTAPAGAFRGRLAVLVGHVRGRRLHPPPRYIDADLNRSFLDTDAPNPGARGIEELERRELVAAIDEEVRRARGPAALVDLHTTSADAPPFAFVEDALPARELARALPVPLVLGVEEELPGLLVDDVTHRHTMRTVVFESGRHDDPRSVDLHEAALWLLLDAIGCGGGDPARIAAARARLANAAGHRAAHVYDVRHRQPVLTSAFRMQPGADAFDRVVARRTVIAHDDGRALRSPVPGLLFMPNRQSEKRPGDDGYFILRRVGNIWLWLSARLRGRPLVHRLLRGLPGIRPHPSEPTALCVDPDIAAVMKRRVFHLLGYRLRQYGPEAVRSAPRRLARAAIQIVAHAFSRQRDLEDHEYWVIDRHRLDVE